MLARFSVASAPRDSDGLMMDLVRINHYHLRAIVGLQCVHQVFTFLHCLLEEGIVLFHRVLLSRNTIFNAKG